jgi:hypothetical protein
MLTRQKEFARKVFDIAVQGAQDTAQLSRQSTSEAVQIIQNRIKAAVEEIRSSISHEGGKPTA